MFLCEGESRFEDKLGPPIALRPCTRRRMLKLFSEGVARIVDEPVEPAL
jgi:hypothetical protein